ncbi:cryptochrome/photolyase family protein [Aquabacterium sp.]|uniref:cryptochrome/photolyase family protein n=1 Tax=Aquabacterium sp. TaxID=1872578 RepID=UPI003B72BF02
MSLTLRLILGDQLNPQHSWFNDVQPDVVYVLMEIRQETDYVLHHAQKVLAIFAAMRAFAAALKESGHRVRYVRIGDPSNRQSLTDNLDALIRHYQASSFAYQAPDEYRLDQQLSEWAHRQQALGLTVTCVDSEHFFSDRRAVTSLFGERRQWLMEHFYRHMRRQHQVLMSPDGQPEGERWNFDSDNRQAWRGSPQAPADWRGSHDHRALWQEIEAAGIQTFGEPDAHQLRWPVHRAEALQHLDSFVTHALPWFGTYQDAMSQTHQRLFHSLLSFALNTKMLNPREVVRRAEQAWTDGHAPLSSVEGFIRQILGWREYVRGVYWAHMPGYAERNALQHDRPLPDWFWTGDTGMACVSVAIRQSLNTAYAHHIQRLMVIGNFALLAGLAPQAVHRWYLGVYADAFEWVEVPNTLGMSQFADGGLLATKPYVGSASYVHRMSDHCGHCTYRRQDRIGLQACPFNALYWDFHMRHATHLRSNPRLSMVYKNLDRMTVSEREAVETQARAILLKLDTL